MQRFDPAHQVNRSVASESGMPVIGHRGAEYRGQPVAQLLEHHAAMASHCEAHGFESRFKT
jgi:hypothetical protein